MRLAVQSTLTLALLAPAAGAEPPVINVTATRSAQTADETLAAVTVIHRAEIENAQARDLAELLDGRAGIQFQVSGGYGKVASAFMRGANAGHVLVLVDGVRVASPSLGTISWQYLPLAEIERIEIVRGPRSHLYGSDAIGGVIQIFTRSTADPRRHATLGAGSQDTRRAAAGFTETLGETVLDAGLSRFETAGQDSSIDNNPDRDGFEETSLDLGLSRDLGRWGSLRLGLLHSTGENEYDGWQATSRYENDFTQQVLDLDYQLPVNERWEMHWQLGEYREEATDFADGAESFVFDTRRRQALWQQDLLIGEYGVLNLGLDWSEERLSSSSEYSRKVRENRALFVQYQGDYGLHRVNAALRIDDNESFGSHRTGQLAWGRAIGDLELSLSYATAFKAPTFNDLYYLDPWGSSGNPDLEPEESATYEFGLRGDSRLGRWELRLFRNEVDQLIQWTETAPWVWRPSNLAGARIDGLELSLAKHWGPWSLSGDLSALDAADRDTGLRLPRRAERLLRLDLERTLGKVRGGLTWRLQGDSYDDAENLRRVSGRGLLDLRLSYPLDARWTLRGEATNLFDRAYETAAGYRGAERSLFLSLTYAGG